MNVKKFIKPVIIGVILAVVLAMVPAGVELNKALQPSRADDTDFSKSIPEQITTNQILPPTITPTPFPELSVDKILAVSRNQIASQVTGLPQQQVIQVILVGDMMLGRAVNFNMHRKDDFGYPVAKVAEKLKQADLVIANLEAPILIDCPLTTEGMKLCTDYQSLYTLYFAGIDTVQLANNHVADYGQEGIKETQKWVEFQGLQSVGLGKAAIKEIRGIKVGVLAYSQVLPVAKGVETADPDLLQQEIAQLKQEADVVIVGFHWGNEYQAQPNGQQIQLAHAAIDSGADVVFGHHPHWIQGIEIYQGKPIFYSLGNFVFDQMWSRETREGLAVELNFWQQKLVEVRLLPTFMGDFSQPDWQPVGVGNVTLGRVEKLSQSLGK